MGPRVVRLLLVPHLPAYSGLLDRALSGGRPSSVRRLEAERVRFALLSAFRLAWCAPAPFASRSGSARCPCRCQGPH